MLSLDDLHGQIDEALAVNSVESTYSYEFYTDIINEQRALWLRNEYNKNRSIDPFIIQDLSCLELEQVDPIQCCIPVPSGCKVLRTKEKIPNTIELFFKKAIVSVGPADIMKPRFLLIDYSRVPYAGTGRTNQKAIYTFLYDQYLYVFSRDTTYSLMQYITLRGIFEDPTELGAYVNCQTNTSCWKPSDPYPINSWMWAYIKPIVLQQLMQRGMFQYDDANDTADQRVTQKTGQPQ